MPDSPLVELKKALNAVVPQIVDRGHTALALNENASEAAFTQSYSRTIESIQVFLSTASPDLRALAGNRASLLTDVKVTGELDAATLAALQMLGEASAADTANRYSAGVKQTVGLINDVVARAQALPEAQRTSLNTESRRLTAARNPTASNNSAGAEARELMAVSDSYLGITGNPGSNTDVLENTGRALKDYLKEQQAAHPEIDVDFAPQRIDGRTVAFMRELMRQKMEAAGVKQEDLQTTLFQLWLMQRNGQEHPNPAMRDLGRTGAMSALVDYALGGRLPTGARTEIPRTDSPWENPVKDRFFNRAVYVDLLNGDTVSNKSLLRPDGADAGQQTLIREAMQKLGISDNLRTYSRDQVGAIATEIMVAQARALCIEEKDISAAMLTGRFNPDMDDIFLAHIGMGKPERNQARAEQLERIGISREEQHDVFFDAQFQRHRDAQWSQRFGGVTDEHLFRLAQRLRPDAIPQNLDLKYSDLRGDPNVESLMNDLRSRNVSPAGLFMWGGRGGGDPYNFREVYRGMRENTYLPRLREQVNENGLNLCEPGSVARSGGTTGGARPATGDDGRCFADDAAGPCDTNGGSTGSGTTGQRPPNVGQCFADDVDGPCSTTGSGNRTSTTGGSGDGKCYADDFGSACGTPNAGTGETIRANAGDSTGQTPADVERCYADDAAGPDCNKTPQVVPVR